MRKLKILATLELDVEIDERGLSAAQSAAITTPGGMHTLCHSLAVQAGAMALSGAPCDRFSESCDSEGNLRVEVNIHGALPRVPMVMVRDFLDKAIEEDDKEHNHPIKDTGMARAILSKLLTPPSKG